MDSPEFNAWSQGKSHTLFCPGIPGAGKTVLASIVIEHLLRLAKNEQVNVTFLYCSYKRQEDQTVEKLLAAILRQLAEQYVLTPESAENLYTSHVAKGTRPSSKEIFSTLLAAASNLSRMFIVIDALDECSLKTRMELLPKIQELQRRARGFLLVTSRPIDEIQQFFAQDLQLQIQAHKEDVESYVDSQLVKLSHCVRNNLVMQEKIKKHIAKSVDGMLVSTTMWLYWASTKSNPTQVSPC